MDAKTLMVSHGYTEQDFWNCTIDQLDANIESILRLQADNRVVEFQSLIMAIGSALGGKKAKSGTEKYIKSLRGEK